MSDTVLQVSDSCCDSCSGKKSQDKNNGRARIARLCIGLAIYIVALIGRFQEPINLSIYLLSYMILGVDVIITAIKNVFKGKLFDENFLMSISTVGAFVVGQYAEAVAVMAFYQVGEYFQDLAVDKSRRSIRTLMDMDIATVNIVKNGTVITIPPQEAEVGDILMVKPGEKVALDGIIVEGKSQIDQSSLTGESVPCVVGVGDQALSGSINMDGVLKIKASKIYSESSVARIMELVEEASSRKAPTERFISRFSKVYTPVVVIVAAILAFIPPLVIRDAVFMDWLYRALIFLVVSCPCALVVSVPLTFFSGIGSGAKKGILIKGSNYLQSLAQVDTIVFDKTGTLTEGIFDVTLLEPRGITENELLQKAYSLEVFSNHPIAGSIKTACEERNIEVSKNVTDYEEIGGMGLKAKVDGLEIITGNSRLMKSYGVTYEDYDGAGSVVHVAENSNYFGFIVISDKVKTDAARAVSELSLLGIKNVHMLTGDRKEAGEKIAAQLGILPQNVHTQLLPHQKVEELEFLYTTNPASRIVFVGDGINDAPVLARADVGIAMGGIGSDAAIEAADIVLMSDEPSKIPLAIHTARRTMQIVKENIIFALAIKFLILGLAAFGHATMWMAVFADVGVEFLVVLNAMKKK